MILLSAVRGLALVGLFALPDVGTPVAAAGPVDLVKTLCASRGHDSAQLASQLTSFGGFISGMHALQGAVQVQIEFRPMEGEDNLWDVYLWTNDEGWVHAGEASVNYAGDLLVDGDNGTGFASFVCHDGGPWTWTVYSSGTKIGSGTMS